MDFFQQWNNNLETVWNRWLTSHLSESMSHSLWIRKQRAKHMAPATERTFCLKAWLAWAQYYTANVYLTVSITRVLIYTFQSMNLVPFFSLSSRNYDHQTHVWEKTRHNFQLFWHFLFSTLIYNCGTDIRSIRMIYRNYKLNISLQNLFLEYLHIITAA